MQDFFRCDAGYEARADVVATTCCKKLVVDMHYEARIQAIAPEEILHTKTMYPYII